MVHVSVRSLQQVPPSPSHLLLDALDLSLQPLDQPVELRDLTPGALQIISMPAGRGLQLTQLCPKGVTCSERLWGLTGPLIQPLQCHKQEKKKKKPACGLCGVTQMEEPGALFLHQGHIFRHSHCCFLTIHFAPGPVFYVIEAHVPGEEGITTTSYEWKN